MIRKQFGYLSAIILLVAILFMLSLFAAGYLAENDTAQSLVRDFGYLGIFVLALIGGFNLAVPIPAAVFTPIFLASGLPMIGIILTLALGTTAADALGYIIGRWGRKSWDVEDQPFFQKVKELRERYQSFLIPIIFLYAALVPYPNELIVVPLAFLGVHFRTMIIPLFLGSLIYNTILVLGISGITELLKF